MLRENHLFWFCLLPKKWCWKHFPFFFFNVFIINILYTVAESGKKISAGPNHTTLICLNIKYHLKYANIQKLHEKLFLINGKGRKCPKCLTIKINGSIFFLIKKKETEKRAHYFLKKNKKRHVVRNIAQNSHASKLLSRLAQDKLRPKVKVFKRHI